MPAQALSPALFFDTIGAYQRTEALRAAIELDLFSHVASGQRTATDLASCVQATPRGIRILADYLTIIGFFRKLGDRYELTAEAKVFLDRESPAYLGGTLSFLLAPRIEGMLSELTAAVRRGGTAVSEEGTVSHDNPIWVDFARAMAPLMQLPAQLLAGLVGGDSRATAARAGCRRGARLVRHRDRGTLSPSPRHRSGLAEMCWRSRRRMLVRQVLPTGMLCFQVVPSTSIGAARTTSCC